MIRRRRHRGHRRPVFCATPGCVRPRHGDRRFCVDCWYQLSSAVRLAIDEARAERLFYEVRGLCHAVARQLARRMAQDSEPAVGVCGVCQRSSADPVTYCCTARDCPLALKVAA